MRILVACEESQRVTTELRIRGHEAYSCDLEPCSGGHPGWHLQEDVLPLLGQDWDMIIAFPPCTYISCVGTRHFGKWKADGRQQEGIDFFMQFVNCKCPRLAIENPVGVMSTHYRKPDQIIHPWMFGDPVMKRTCLWLRGLPLLEPTDIVDKGEFVMHKDGRRKSKWLYADTFRLPPKERSRVRSTTFPGIAKAMAEQWTN